MKQVAYLLLAGLLCGMACGDKSHSEKNVEQKDSTSVAKEYHNPVIRIAAPDPTARRDLLFVCDGGYPEPSDIQVGEYGGLGGGRHCLYGCDPPGLRR